MMKKMTRFLAFLLALVMVLGMVPPMEIRAEDYIISIHNAEEFMAIMDNPGGSYRLENSINLGIIQPLGTFSGSLDGNGQTVSYSMSYTSGCKLYGLFSKLNNAEISNLNVNGSISLDISDSGEYFVGILAGYVSGGSLGGGNISGSIDISGSAGSVVAGGVAGRTDGAGYYMNTVTVSVHANARTGENQSCSYYGTVSGGEAQGCYIYGSTNMEGKIWYVTLMPGGNDNTVDQNVTVNSTNGAVVTGISGGERNKFYGNFNIAGNGGSVTAINGGTGQKYEGDIVSNGVGACMASGVTGAEVKGNITAVNAGAMGMRSCRNSTMNGNITVTKSSGGTVYGMSKCSESIFNGSIIYSAVGQCRIYAATDCNHVQVNGNFVLNQKDPKKQYNGGAYALIGCDDSQFDGTIYVSGYNVHAYGECNGDYNVVNADIMVESQVQSTAQGVGSNGSFEGSIQNPKGSVIGCGENSIAKGTLTGNSVTATGGNSYFSGTITARYGGLDNKASASIGYAADATVTVEGGDNGASFNPGSYFGGTATVSAADGSIGVEFHEGMDIPITHKASGVSTSTQDILARSDRQEIGYAEVAWHRRAEKYGQKPEDCSGYIYYGYHTYTRFCYDYIIGVSRKDSLGSNLEDLDWNGCIDPVNGTFKPEKDPVDYVLKVTLGGQDCLNCRLSIGGSWYYPDDSGSIAVTNGPATISPLVVQLKNQDGTYTEVLRRSAYYPVPNMVNPIRLEPNVDKLDISLVAEGYSGQESGESWGGIPGNMFDKIVDIFRAPMEINISGLGAEFTYKKQEMENGRQAFHVGLNFDPTSPKAQKILDNPWNISAALRKSGAMTTVKEGFMKNAVRVAGVETKIGALGYVEVMLNPTTNVWESKAGKIGVVLGGSKRITYQIPQLLWLVYVTGQLDLEGQGDVGFREEAQTDSVDSVKLTPYGTLSLTGGGELGVGGGARCFNVFGEGGVRLELGGSWELPHKTAAESLALDATVHGFVEWKVFHLGGRTNYDGKTWSLWPNTPEMSVPSAEEFSPLTRGYLNSRVAETMLSDGSGTGGAVNIPMLTGSSAYPYSEVQLLGLDDGRYVLIYTDDDVSRGDADRSALRARIGVETDGVIHWGEAITIESDGTADYAFNACASYNEVAVVWQDMDTAFGSGEGVSMDEAAAHVDLTQAVLDCSGDVPQVVRTATLATGNGQMESLPMIFYHADPNGETLRTAWTTSTASNPVAVDENTKYTLWLSQGFGQAGQMVREDMTAITGIALYGEELLWSTAVGDSGDLWLRTGDGTVSRQRESGVMNLQGVGHRYIFTEGNTLMGGEWGFDSCSLQAVTEYTGKALRLSSTGEVYFADLGLENGQVYWLDGSVARPVGEYEGYLSSWDAAHGQVVTLLRTGFEDSDTASLTSQGRQDIQRIGLEVACDDPQAVPGSIVTMHVSAENQGTYGYDALFVQVMMDDGTVLYEKEMKESLEAGEEKLLSFGFLIPEGFTSQEVTLTVGPSTQRVFLGGTNLALNAQWSENNPAGTTVILENTGNAEASGTVTVTDEAGKVLVSQEVTLAQGEIRLLWMDFGTVYTQDTRVTVTLTEAENALDSDDNQVILTVLASQEPQQPENPNQPDDPDQPEDPTQPEEPSKPEDPTQPGEPQKPSTNPDNPFTDVPSDRFEKAILWAYTNGITTGTTATTFSPENPCTRKQIVTFLWRAAGEPEPKSMVNPFTDVKADRFEKAILWAYYEGITTGTGDGSTFSGEATCTRKQIVTFLWRFRGQPDAASMENPFVDVKADRFEKAILWAYYEGITTGTGNGTTFSPENPCTRKQIVTFLYRDMVE